MNLLRLSKNNTFIYTLSKIRKTIPTTIIAGGAIRDLYHNKPINDVDIYVSLSAIEKNIEIDTEKFWIQMFDIDSRSLFNHEYIKQLGGDDEESYEEKNHIGLVWEIRKSGILYNIIVVDIDPIEYVTRYFDIGLCKAYCDGTKIHLTADFMHDSQFKCLTVVSEEMPQTEFDHMMEYHVKKLKNKYPEHTLVIPPAYEELYKEYNKKI